MKTSGTFSFDGYEVHKNRTTLLFRYSISAKNASTRFEERILLPEPISPGFNSLLLEKIMQNLLLVLGLSYWKTTCAPSIFIKSFSLTSSQADFWNTLYTKGLGEFFYRNSIDYRKLVKFPSNREATVSPLEVSLSDRPLVGIGGGKDSIITAKTLEAHSVSYTAVVFEGERPFPVINTVVSRLKAPVLKIRRILDPQLFAMNTQGYYNGHVPISSVYAFLGVAAALLYGYRYMIVSNEKSANSGNVLYFGTEINHQWSKSLEFEKLFQTYVRTFISPDVTYFSFLRPLNELQIMREFVKYREYLTLFASCNRNFTVKQDKPKSQLWCGVCPKCAFVFTLLAAFTAKATAVSVFGKNLFEDVSLIPTFRKLLGIEEFKPFECVGTYEEVREAFRMIAQKHEFDDSPVMRIFLNEAVTGLKNESDVKSEQSPITSLIPSRFLPIVSTIL